ncbi:hypothetical protein [Nocardioides gilvus]|uniref:hypothetical protein n=1 Tax=Nocardioides gilvus TaxID=1735589 RepID=UPI000D74DBC2|nr:hypothetical protein [Nocardioides gilvus]
MTTKTFSVTTGPVRLVRSSLRLFVPLGILGSVLLAAPALAERPEAWETPESVGFLDFFLLVLVFPLVATAVITLLTILPALVKGEKLSPNAAPIEDQWLGGPKGGKAELEGSDAAKNAGGASGQW